MVELQRWLDAAPTLRQCCVEFNGWSWAVELSVVEPLQGIRRNGKGDGDSLTFAVVAAILDLRSKET